jgi:adenylosuccinate lyase
MSSSDFLLTAISPIDGRYRNSVDELSNYSSEFALIKYRTKIELKYLIALSKTGVTRKLSKPEIDLLEKIYLDFKLADAEKVKDLEDIAKHDVKAVEYFLAGKLSKTSIKDLVQYIHFGLTSEDTNNLSYRLMLKDANSEVILRTLDALIKTVNELSEKYKNLPMLARTHGQPAVPTSLGKEFLVFYERLQTEIKILQSFKFRGKLNGAVGNYSALTFAYPKINWKKFSKDFVNSLGLDWTRTTTQVAPNEDVIFYFQTVQRINGILLDFNQDMWRYISDGWFNQLVKRGEVGSSTMPQKVNPILFENSEGNIIMANSLISGFVDKLPLSRLQRDLSGSTITRNYGAAIAYSLIAYKNSLSGLLRIKPNEEKIKQDLNQDWSILSEAVQIYLKKTGVKEGYEIIKEKTRGAKMTKEMFLEMVDSLPLDEKGKQELKKLYPENYIGIV